VPEHQPPNVLISLRALRQIQQCARLPVHDQPDESVRERVRDASDRTAEAMDDAAGDFPEGQFTVELLVAAGFNYRPEVFVYVRLKRVRGITIDPGKPAFPRRMRNRVEAANHGNLRSLELLQVKRGPRHDTADDPRDERPRRDHQ